MPEIAALLPSARKYRTSAVGELLEAYYPTVHRISYALCGDESAARDVIQRVFSRALPAIPKWRDDSAADRWFYHYTTLESRQHAVDTSNHDPLDTIQPQNPAYTAFIRGLRGLPAQQREAIVLNHGEHLNPRYLGVAMDCSAEAAANHLRVATLHLQSIAGEQFNALLDVLVRSYQTLSPNPATARPLIRRRIDRFLRPKRLKRALVVLILIAITVLGIMHYSGL